MANERPWYVMNGTKSFIKIDRNKIIYLVADGNYTKIKTTEEEITVLQLLKNLERKIHNKNFYRIHKSVIINITHVKEFTLGKTPKLIMTNKQKFVVSKSYINVFNNKMLVYFSGDAIRNRDDFPTDPSSEKN